MPDLRQSGTTANADGTTNKVGRPQKLTPNGDRSAEYQQAKQMYELGVPNAKIARKLGIAVNTLKDLAKRHGWQKAE